MLDRAEIDLAPCRVETWGGCAFINHDENVPSLLDSLGPIATRLGARNTDKLKMDWWFGTVLPTNWKLAMEAFQEGYHVMQTHPQLHVLSPGSPHGADAEGFIPTPRKTAREAVDQAVEFYACIGEGMAGMIHQSEIDVLERMRDMEVPDDPMAAFMALSEQANVEITRDGLERGAPMFDIPAVNAEHGMISVEYMFPHYFLLPTFAAMSAYRIRPLSPETCFFELWSLVLRPEDEVFETPTEPTLLPYNSPEFPPIPRQDYSNLPRQQLGLHAGSFKHMRLAREQEGMISNYQRLVDGYLAGLDDETLRKGQNIVNCGYDCPIHDIGF